MWSKKGKDEFFEMTWENEIGDKIHKINRNNFIIDIKCDKLACHMSFNSYWEARMCVKNLNK